MISVGTGLAAAGGLLRLLGLPTLGLEGQAAHALQELQTSVHRISMGGLGAE